MSRRPARRRRASAPVPGPTRSSLLRATGFLVLWLILFGFSPGDLAVGAAAAVMATWASLRLLPPGRWRPHPIELAQLALRFFCQSVLAGADVARRALDPRLPLRPGFVAYPTRFPPGTVRNVFTTLTSLLPGTVPVGTDGGRLVYHCLDVDQPVASQLAAEEAALSRAIRHE
jgi:multicomponent Na+:H+ antiporter subunit E